jgi:hypothetical protein
MRITKKGSYPKSEIGDKRFPSMSCELPAAPRVLRDDGNAAGSGRRPLVGPISLDSRTTGYQFGSRRGSDRSDNRAFLPKESMKPVPSAFPAVAGSEYAAPSCVAETAPSRKFKDPKGLRHHHTFRIGATKNSSRKTLTPGMNSRMFSRKRGGYRVFKTRYILQFCWIIGIVVLGARLGVQEARCAMPHVSKDKGAMVVTEAA